MGKTKKKSQKKAKVIADEEVDEKPQEETGKESLKRKSDDVSEDPPKQKKLKKRAKGGEISKEEETMPVEEEEEVVDDAENEDIDDEDEDEDDDSDSDHDTELMKDDGKEKLDFDFEAFPVESDDKMGVVNMLTQIFLRADIDTPGMADDIIKQSPFGSVVGDMVRPVGKMFSEFQPAVDESAEEEEKENVVYGILTALELDATKESCPKYVKEVWKMIKSRAMKNSTKEISRKVEELENQRVGMLVNERMLHFPMEIVAPSFASLQNDLDDMKKPFKHVMYILKLRIADEKEAGGSNNSKMEAKKIKGEKKKKLGKAEKKRLAAEALAGADVIYDNPEDAELSKLSVGEGLHFDYPVHMDVDPSSKFHTIEKEGVKYKPYRRVVFMDAKRFNSFVSKLSSLK